MSKTTEEVQRARVAQGIGYAEAVKKVSSNITEATRQIGNKITVVGKYKSCDKLKEETLIVNKNDFVLFMAEIINCSAQTQSRN